MNNDQGVTVVTGGNRGIGAAISKRLLAAGYQVVSLARKEAEFAHDNLTNVVVDLADRKATRAALESIAKNHQILRLVHNAGVIRPALIEDVSLDDLDYLTELHLATMVSMVQVALPAMKEAGWGRVVGVSSRGALGLQTRTNYSATKSGMFGMLRTWALELGPQGITSNCVAPGPIESDMFDEIMQDDKERIDGLANAIPRKRIGKPEDVAGAVEYFLRDDSDFVTGQTLYVCGGTSIGSVVI